MTEASGRIIARGQNATGSVFDNTRLDKARMHDVSMTQARFRDVTLAGSQMQDVDLSGVAIRNANLTNLSIVDANMGGMTINGILVSDLLAKWAEV